MRIATRVAAAAAIPTLLFALAACSSDDKGASNTSSDTNSAPASQAATRTDAVDASATTSSGRVVTVHVTEFDGPEADHYSAKVKPGDTLRVVVSLPENFVEEGFIGDCIEGDCPAFLGKGKVTLNGTSETVEYPVTGTGKADLALVFDNRHDADQPNQPYDAANASIAVTSDQ